MFKLISFLYSSKSVLNIVKTLSKNNFKCAPDQGVKQKHRSPVLPPHVCALLPLWMPAHTLEAERMHPEHRELHELLLN